MDERSIEGLYLAANAGGRDVDVPVSGGRHDVGGDLGRGRTLVPAGSGGPVPELELRVRDDHPSFRAAIRVWHPDLQDAIPEPPVPTALGSEITKPARLGTGPAALSKDSTTSP